MSRMVLLVFVVITILLKCEETESFYATALTGLMNLIGILSGMAGLYDFAVNHIKIPDRIDSRAHFIYQEISVTEEMEELKKDLSNLREIIRFDKKIDQLVNLINDVEHSFKLYNTYKRNNFSKTVHQNYYPNLTYEKYADNIFSYESGVERTLHRIKDTLVTNYFYSPGLYSLQLTVLKSKELGLVCKTKQSAMQIIGELLGKIAVIEAKGIIMILFAYDIYEWLGKGISDELKYNAQRESLERYNQIVAQFKESVNPTYNQLYVCDPDKHLRNQTYIVLDNNPFHREDYENKCSEFICSILRNVGTNICHYLYSSKKNCTVSYRDPPVDSLVIPESPRRLNRPNTVNVPCSNIMLSSATTKFYEFAYRVDTCHFCVCDSSKYKYKVSLSFTSSQVSQNYVITGARLRIEDNVIYVQLQEGQLGPFGSINETTLRWIPVNKDDDLTIPFSIFDNQFDLNHVTVPPNNVVTGVQIISKKYKLHSYRFGLKLDYATINYANGDLNLKTIRKLEASGETRSNIPVAYMENPISTNKNVLDSVDTDYVTFYYNADARGTTLPYVDLQDVASGRSSPLSGLGFIHKGTPTSAGFLGLSIYTYDMSPHVQREYISKEQFEHLIV